MKASEMTASTFNKLLADAKGDFLWNNGIFVCERNYFDKYIIKTYSILDFWVEVYYENDTGHIVEIYAVEEEQDYDNMLNHIDLTQIL